MTKLVLKGLLLVAPFLALVLFVVAVDPYAHFGLSHLVPDEERDATAGKIHYALWKVERFRSSRATRVMLGDSRMAAFDARSVDKATGKEYFNFAYGGGTLPEIVDTYWLASRDRRLDEVDIELGFINFNANQTLNRVMEAKALVANPLLHLTNRLVLEAAFRVAYAHYSGKRDEFERPPMSRDEFWRFQLEESATQVLRNYQYPDTYAKELERIAEDCRKNGTRLVVIIPPTHVELQAKIAEFKLEREQERFRQFVGTLGSVYDFDYPNAFTEVRENFSDPFHPRDNDPVIREVWGHEVGFARHRPESP